MTTVTNDPAAEARAREVIDRHLAERFTPPTESEISAALARKASDSTDKFMEAIDGYLDVLGYTEDDGDDPVILVSSGLWTDLRPSEAARLRQLINVAREKALTAAHDTILREALAAALTFAAEYPEAPRAQPVQDAPGAATSRA